FLIGGLMVGATIVLYDGSPAYPDMRALWRLAAETGMTYFGTSAPFIQACMKAGIEPGREADLRRLRGLGSTGAPLPPDGFQWVYEHVSRDLLLGSLSGGTDACAAFVLMCPILPVCAGEIQCRGLGAKVEAFDEQGRAHRHQRILPGRRAEARGGGQPGGGYGPARPRRPAAALRRPAGRRRPRRRAARPHQAEAARGALAAALPRCDLPDRGDPAH